MNTIFVVVLQYINNLDGDQKVEILGSGTSEEIARRIVNQNLLKYKKHNPNLTVAESPYDHTWLLMDGMKKYYVSIHTTLLTNY